MSADKYLCIFSRQMKAIVYIVIPTKNIDVFDMYFILHMTWACTLPASAKIDKFDIEQDL